MAETRIGTTIATSDETTDPNGGVAVRLSHQFEQFILAQRSTTVDELARRFGISRRRCWEELAEILPYGVSVTQDGHVFVEHVLASRPV